MTPLSATRRLYRTRSASTASIFPVNENHSDIVKFHKGDPNCQVVLGKLREICQAQEAESHQSTHSKPTSMPSPERH